MDENDEAYNEQYIYRRKKKEEYLIPFYSEKNKFEIPDQKKIKNNHLNYITQSIKEINLELNELNIPLWFKFKKILIYFFGFVLFLITLFISITFSIFALFNPMIIIFILFFVISKEIKWIVKMYFDIKIKSKYAKMANKINSLNNNINNSKYIWKLGRDYSWVTITIKT